MKAWRRLTLRTATEQADRLVAELWALGTTGIEERPAGEGVVVEAFFPVGSDLPPTAVRRSGEFWAQYGATLDRVETVADEDWNESFRRRARPFAVGERFLIDPREPESTPKLAEEGRFLLRIPARRAFGTGTHESTRLVVEWLESLDLQKRRVLDVGTGTGILALVATRMGAALVVAVDIDAGSAFAAGEGGKLNRSVFPVIAGPLGALRLSETFDFAVVNVLPENIAADLEYLGGLLVSGGRAVFSGILSSRSGDWSRQVQAAGFHIRGRRTDGEWEAWMTQR